MHLPALPWQLPFYLGYKNLIDNYCKVGLCGLVSKAAVLERWAPEDEG